VLSLFAHGVCLAQPIFSGRYLSLGTSASPGGVIAADVNRDGRLDLLTAGAGAISVFLGRNGGQFSPRSGPTVGFDIRDFAMGDLNGDGLIDIAYADYGYSTQSGNVSILLGLGDGTFPESQYRNVAVGLSATDVAIGDLDGDQKLDIAWSYDGRPGFVATFYGNGDGTFVPGPQLETTRTNSIALADLNRDGRADIIANGEDSLLVWVSDTGHTFRSTSRLACVAAYLTVVDLNHDGFLDLVTGEFTYRGCYVTQFRGTGDGRIFRSGSTPASCSVGDVAVADVNGDGVLDFAVSGYATQEAAGILLGPSFVLVDQIPVGELGGWSWNNRVLLADFDGDGRPDLAATDIRAHQLVVARGNGNGSFGRSNDFGAGLDARALSVGDFDQDGLPDLAVACTDNGVISIFRGHGDGEFDGPQHIWVGGLPSSVIARDLDGDGRTDLAAANVGDGTVSVMIQTGTGGLGAARSYRVGGTPVALVAADFNGDGIPDLASANPELAAVSILLGAGDGSFQLAPSAPSFGLKRVDAGDFNEDGFSDLALAGPFGCCGYDGNGKRCICFSEVAALDFNNGDGTFRFQPFFPGGNPGDPGFVMVRDLNLDGHDDVLIPMSELYPIDTPTAHQHLSEEAFGSPFTAILMGRGDGTFDYAQPSVGGSVLDLADFDGDGIPDLCYPTGPGIQLARGDGHGGFFPSGVSYAVTGSIRTIAPVDLNLDGRKDLVLATSRGLTALLNTGGSVPPPLPPTRLDAKAGEASIRLSWQPSHDPTVDAYRVSSSPIAPTSQAGEVAGASSETDVPRDQHSLTLSCLPDVPLRFRVASVAVDGRVSPLGPVAAATPLRVGGELRIVPRSLSRSSQGVLTATLALNSGHSVEDAIVSTITLNGSTAPTRAQVFRNKDGSTRLKVTFSRRDLDLPGGETVPMVVLGGLRGCVDTIRFEVRDTVRIAGADEPVAASDEPGVAPTEAGALGTSADLPRVFALRAPLPSPTRGECRISFDLPVGAAIRLEGFDVSGRMVAVLASGNLPAGRHEARWEVSGLAGGVYFVRYRTPGGTFVRRLVKL
jgi:hypothetical protein